MAAVSRGADPYTNPLYYLRAYGLRNPTVAEALELGAFEEWCTVCRGTGKVFVYCGKCGRTKDGGPKFEACLASPRPDSCQRYVCGRCRGSRLKPAPAVIRGDFGDQASLDVAMRLDRTCRRCKGLNVLPNGKRCRRCRVMTLRREFDEQQLGRAGHSAAHVF
jgi:hypothetical protein